MRYLTLFGPFFLLLTSGCYTRFADFSQTEGFAGAAGYPARADTLRTAERETCIWERDLTGAPYLHCYKGYYPSEWYLYNYSPWWYHSSSHWYDRGRCPPYYYLDPNCGCCRYYLNNPSLRSSAFAPKNNWRNTASTVKDSASRVSVQSSSGTTIYSHDNLKPGPGFFSPSRNGIAPRAALRDSLVARRMRDSAATKSSAPADSTGTAHAVDSADRTARVPVDSAPSPKPMPLRRSARGR